MSLTALRTLQRADLEGGDLSGVAIPQASPRWQ